MRGAPDPDHRQPNDPAPRLHADPPGSMGPCRRHGGQSGSRAAARVPVRAEGVSPSVRDSRRPNWKAAQVWNTRNWNASRPAVNPPNANDTGREVAAAPISVSAEPPHGQFGERESGESLAAHVGHDDDLPGRADGIPRRAAIRENEDSPVVVERRVEIEELNLVSLQHGVDHPLPAGVVRVRAGSDEPPVAVFRHSRNVDDTNTRSLRSAGSGAVPRTPSPRPASPLSPTSARLS